ncbi:hypothetical protein JCM4914_16830 [Streptomyces platensis subsp. malvinus]
MTPVRVTPNGPFRNGGRASDWASERVDGEWPTNGATSGRARVTVWLGGRAGARGPVSLTRPLGPVPHTRPRSPVPHTRPRAPVPEPRPPQLIRKARKKSSLSSSRDRSRPVSCSIRPTR